MLDQAQKAYFGRELIQLTLNTIDTIIHSVVVEGVKPCSGICNTLWCTVESQYGELRALASDNLLMTAFDSLEYSIVYPLGEDNFYRDCSNKTLWVGLSRLQRVALLREVSCWLEYQLTY